FRYVLAAAHRGRERHRVVVAAELLPACLQRFGMSDASVLAEFEGRALEGLMLEHPFQERLVPVVLGEHVTLDAGTGAVHTAPGHGQEDFAVGLRVDEANPVIIAALAERGRLVHEERFRHSYPHCWRHKSPLIFRATPQWF